MYYRKINFFTTFCFRIFINQDAHEAAKQARSSNIHIFFSYFTETSSWTNVWAIIQKTLAPLSRLIVQTFESPKKTWKIKPKSSKPAVHHHGADGVSYRFLLCAFGGHWHPLPLSQQYTKKANKININFLSEIILSVYLSHVVRCNLCDRLRFTLQRSFF